MHFPTAQMPLAFTAPPVKKCSENVRRHAYKSIFEHITPGMNLILEFMERKIPWEYLPAAIDKMYKK